MSFPEDGTCVRVGAPVDLFIHDAEDEDHETKVMLAKSICELCPFKIECVKFGIATQSVGVFGGQWLDLPDEEPPAEVKKK